MIDDQDDMKFDTLEQAQEAAAAGTDGTPTPLTVNLFASKQPSAVNQAATPIIDPFGGIRLKMKSVDSDPMK